MHVTTQLWSAEKVEWAAFPRRPGICAKSLAPGFLALIVACTCSAKSAQNLLLMQGSSETLG